MASNTKEKKKGKLGDGKETVASLKPYTPPEVTHDLDLETRAGTPLIVPEFFDNVGPDL